MATSIQENLVKANNDYAAGFTQGHLALPPAKKYAVGTNLHLLRPPLFLPLTPHSVTCMDARIDPASAYGIALGDAHVCTFSCASTNQVSYRL